MAARIRTMFGTIAGIQWITPKTTINLEYIFRMMLELDSSSDGFYVKDVTNTYVYANAAMGRIVGIAPEHIIGHSDDDIYDSAIATELKGEFLKAVNGGIGWIQNVRVIDGEPKKLLELRVAKTGMDDTIVGVYGICRDISEYDDDFDFGVTQTSGYNSPALQSVERQCLLAAAHNTTILLLGESGSGKGYWAKYLHDHSKRAQEKYMVLNCAALPESLAESELFGHEQGAFTGALRRHIGKLEDAAGGTLLLDEIGDMPLTLQAKLLTFLDSRQFERVGGRETITSDARLIAATNKDLKIEVKQGTFKHDLFHRLNVFPIFVPPLRECREDLPLLVKLLLDELCKKMGLSPVRAVSRPVLRKLRSYKWPGNVRDLGNVLERALILGNGKDLRCEYITFDDPASARAIAKIEQVVACAENERLAGAKLSAAPSKEEVKSLFNQYIATGICSRAGLARHLGMDPAKLKKMFKEAECPAGKAGRVSRKNVRKLFQAVICYCALTYSSHVQAR